jgi:carboxypeptidase Taq
MTTESTLPGEIGFTTSDASISALLEHLHAIEDLSALMSLAEWDQQTYMPRGAGEVRMHQATTLQGIIHEHLTDPKLGTLLDKLEAEATQKGFNDTDRGLLRKARRAYDQATKLPRELVEELTRVGSASFEAWLDARAKSDFAIFAPWLQRTVTLQREVADRLGYAETPYDALLDEYEPGLTASKVEQLFAPVRAISTTMLQRIQDSQHTIDASCLQGNFPTEKQQQLCEQILRVMNYDFTRGGLARSEHPFTTSFGAPFDVRLTTRYNEQYLPMSVMAAMHEAGHGLYEQGISPVLMRTPLANGASLGIHESQSRLWENAIGRSYAFWKGQYGLLRASFPEHFNNVAVETYTRALNIVRPSLIRVEADEVTYNLHIVIRFELEKALVNGNLAVESLPEQWNARYQEYLGIKPSNDVEGVLQDMHWSSGFGYFPTYTLGNLYAAQIYHTLRKDFPDLDERLAGGDISFVLNWLHQHLHQYGATYLPEDLVTRATSNAPDPQYFVDYLTEKFEKIYELPEA